MDYMYRESMPVKRSNTMSIASMVLGIISVVTCTCIYLSFICGALAIILASLSRGGKMTYDSFAKAGLVLGIIGLAITVIFYAYSLILFFNDPHSLQNLEELLREYCEMYGYDFEELYGDFFQYFQ